MKAKTKIILFSVSSFIGGFGFCIGLLNFYEYGATRIFQTQIDMQFKACDSSSGTIFLPAGTKLLQGYKVSYAVDEASVFYVPVSPTGFKSLKKISNSESPTHFAPISTEPK